jgi:hypothetical protein
VPEIADIKKTQYGRRVRTVILMPRGIYSGFNRRDAAEYSSSVELQASRLDRQHAYFRAGSCTRSLLEDAVLIEMTTVIICTVIVRSRL